MANFIRNTQVKAMTSIWTAKQKAVSWLTHGGGADRPHRSGYAGCGDYCADLHCPGRLILAGLYLIVDDTVLPTITQRIKDMFNYGG